jgi:hypothetical protein
VRQNRPLVAYFSERKDDMISDDERERRLMELLALKVLGLVVHRALPDGSGELYYPQPDHPDVLSFRAWRTTHERLLELAREAVRRLAAETNTELPSWLVGYSAEE